MAEVGDAFQGDHECAVFAGDDQGANHRGFRNCKTNPGHKNFMTVDEFRQKASSLIYDKRDLPFYWNDINSTVRVKVSLTSTNRPDTYPGSDVPYPMAEIRGNRFVRYGTGYLDKLVWRDRITEYNAENKKCPCPDCKSGQDQHSKPPFSMYFVILTATHVLFDTSEAEVAEFEFFYDTEDRKGVEFVIYGVEVLDDEKQRLNTDTCPVLCVTHDKHLADILKEVSAYSYHSYAFYRLNPTRMLVSHPHGVCKRISFGELVGMKCFANQRQTFPITLKKGLEVRISGMILDNTDIINVLNLKPVDPDEDDNGDDDGDNNNDDDDDDDDDDDGHKMFRLTSNVTIRSPSIITISTNVDDAHTSLMRYTYNSWWALPSGTQFETDSGTRFSLPHNPDNAGESITFEFYIKDYLDCSPFLCNDDDPSSPVFPPRDMFGYYKYNMASCPGSSGAKFANSFFRVDLDDKYPLTHFGCSGGVNRNGLVNPLRRDHGDDDDGGGDGDGDRTVDDDDYFYDYFDYDDEEEGAVDDGGNDDDDGDAVIVE